MPTFLLSRTLQKTSVKATQSGTPGQFEVGRKLRSRAANRLSMINQGRTGSRMREEEKVGCMAERSEAVEKYANPYRRGAEAQRLRREKL
jgi:hypothetical protein